MIANDKEARRLQLHKKRLGADQFTGGLTYAAVFGDGAYVRRPGGEVLWQFHFDLCETIFIGGNFRLEHSRIFEIFAHGNNAQVAAPATAA